MSRSNLSNLVVRDRYVAGSPVDANPGSGVAPPSGDAPAHAGSHEDGGTDEIDVTGLSGLLADPQTPADHTHPELEGGWIPLVDGAEPPVLISDGDGVLILVAL